MRIQTILSAGAALAVLAQPTWAQDHSGVSGDATNTDTTSTDATPLATTRTDDGAIIVSAKHFVPDGAITANKSAIPLIQTPQSISVVTRDQMDLLAFVDDQQAVRYVSGVFGENYGSDPRYDFITVRGFNPKQYVDGLAVPATSTINSVGLDLYAFQSLDILKGPSSTLYGNVPPGGLYNLTSRRAASTTGGELQVKYGSDDFKQIAGTVTGPATDWLALRFTGLYRDRGDEIDHLHAKRLMVAPTATVKIGSSTKITPLVYYQYDDITGGNGGFLPEIGTLVDNPEGKRIARSTNLGDPRNEYVRRQWGAGWDAEQKLGSDLTFRSNTKWSHYRERTYNGLYAGGGYTDDTDTTVQQWYFPNAERVRSFATDNRLEGAASTGTLHHKLLAGVDYRNVVNVAQFGFGFNGAVVNAYDPVYPTSIPAAPALGAPYNDERLRQTGVYGQDEINLGQLYVTLGGRYDWVKLDDRVGGNRSNDGKFSWRAGANYVTDSGIAPYVSYSTSFEPVLGRATNSDGTAGDAFKPSKGRQWEGGVKYDARGLSPDVKLFATAALFDIVQSNVVTVGANLTPLSGTQAGKVEVWGGELELVARIHEQLSINASYSYNHSRVTESATAIEVGAELPTTPKHKLSAFADYTIARGPLAGFGGGFGGRYTSSSVGALPSAFSAPIRANSSTLFDAILHYDLPGWRLAVNGSNIFDKKYVARCSSSTQCFYGAGRQILGTLTRKF